MPEGDTIFRTADTLRRAIGGQVLTGFHSPLPHLARACLVGRVVQSIDTHGKNLFIRFDDGRTLYSHMRMTGSWHIYRPGERWFKPERYAKAVLETSTMVAVCFSAPVVELLTPQQEESHPALMNLGPDILKPFDIIAVCRRYQALGSLPIGVALLEQGALAGIGNIYKSETLFLCRVNPFRSVESLTEDELKCIVLKARKLMGSNLSTSPRVTRPAMAPLVEKYWVYRRSFMPCLQCGEQVQMRRQGEDMRSTYFCPACQRV